MGHGGKSLECNGGAGPEALTESLGDGSGDGSQGNAVHSTEALHLHRQMLACKPLDEGGLSTSRATGKAKKKEKEIHPHLLSFLLLFPSCFLSPSSFKSFTQVSLDQCSRANYCLSFCLSASFSWQIFAVVHTLNTNYSQC